MISVNGGFTAQLELGGSVMLGNFNNATSGDYDVRANEQSYNLSHRSNTRIGVSGSQTKKTETLRDEV